ncbi:unnamed protein product [Sympodiomycopsis kandeliae]
MADDSHPAAAEQDPQTHDQAASIEQVAPTLPSNRSRPDAHTQRYDRQLRLWASSGQASLESARVLLIGATHLGAQVMKNLILPGIGSFTVLDGQIVGPNDVGNNFFVEPESIGKPRAEEVATFLSELNPSVQSSAKVADPETILNSDSNYFSTFSIIIAVNQPMSVLLPLSDIAWQARSGIGIPLMSVQGAGMVGQVQVQVKEMGIIETHPASTVDLRLTSPWPELQSYAQAYDVENQDAMAHSHIPFIVILLRALDSWKSQHGGSLPTPSSDRKPFADHINAMRDPKNLDTENFDEAISSLGQNIWRPISSNRKIPAELQDIFKDSACENITSKSTNFWLLIRALRDFVQTPSQHSPSGGEGHLPLPGSLPDFKASSSTYVEVQKLFRQKAQRDLEGLKGHLVKVLESVGLPPVAIADSEVESFAKHAGYVKLIRGRSLRERHADPAKGVAALAFMDPINPSTLQNHLAFIACDRFYERHRRFPGSSRTFSDSITGSGPSHTNPNSPTQTRNTRISPWRSAEGVPDSKRQKSESPFLGSGDADGDSQMKDSTPTVATDDVDVDGAEGDEAEVLEIASRVLTEWEIVDEDQVEKVLDAVKEMTRSGHGDIASTASLLGGIAAQEAIKFITQQYIPLEGTAIYDGIKQAVGHFNL